MGPGRGILLQKQYILGGFFTLSREGFVFQVNFFLSQPPPTRFSPKKPPSLSHLFVHPRHFSLSLFSPPQMARMMRNSTYPYLAFDALRPGDSFSHCYELPGSGAREDRGLSERKMRERRTRQAGRVMTERDLVRMYCSDGALEAETPTADDDITTLLPEQASGMDVGGGNNALRQRGANPSRKAARRKRLARKLATLEDKTSAHDWTAVSRFVSTLRDRVSATHDVFNVRCNEAPLVWG